MKFLRHVLPILPLAAIGCAPAAATTDGGAPPPADSGGGVDGGGGEAGPGEGGAGDAGADGPIQPPGAVRYTSCPIDKPQKVYGYALNAKAFLDSDETWTPDNVYLVFGRLHVPTSLTIQAGTVVCFDYGPPGEEGSPDPIIGELMIEPKGTLKVMGTSQSHVVFAQKNDIHQYWKGITLNSGFTAATTMQYLDLYNTGLSASGPALATIWDPTQPPLDMQNVIFYSVQRVGLRNFTSGFTPASKVTLYNFADETAPGDFLSGYPALSVNPVGASTVTDQVFQIGPNLPAATKYVQLDHPEGGDVDTSFRLHKLQTGLSWRTYQNMKLQGPTLTPTVLTIDPGAVVAISNGGPVKVGDGGATSKGDIVAVGTAQNPIVFTSDAPMLGNAPKPGDYNGILFNPANFNPAVSKFDYVRFEYGGGGAPVTIYNCNDTRSDVYAELEFDIGIGVDYDGPPVTHATFANSGGQAIRARNNGAGSGTLKTDYTAPANGNTFTGFTTPVAQFPMACP